MWQKKKKNGKNYKIEDDANLRDYYSFSWAAFIWNGRQPVTMPNHGFLESTTVFLMFPSLSIVLRSDRSKWNVFKYSYYRILATCVYQWKPSFLYTLWYMRYFYFLTLQGMEYHHFRDVKMRLITAYSIRVRTRIWPRSVWL